MLNEEEREHQRKIMQAMNQGFVYTVPDGSPLNGHVSTTLSKRELQEMMLQEHGTPSRLMPFFLGDKDEDEDREDDELTQRLRNKEPSETESAVFLTRRTMTQRSLGFSSNNSFGPSKANRAQTVIGPTRALTPQL